MQRALRPDRFTLSRNGFQPRTEPGERIAVRPDRVHSHAQSEPRVRVRCARARRCRRRECRHVRQRATHAVRWRQAIRQRIARARNGSTRHLLESEGRLRIVRSGAGLGVPNSVVALIPARAGSKRLANKNIRLLAGHPVIAYTIAAARESGIFDAIIVSTDSAEYAEIARHYGAEVPFLRPAPMAGDLSPDIEWIEHALGELREHGREFDCFSLLRPTSPFRRSETIQ